MILKMTRLGEGEGTVGQDSFKFYNSGHALVQHQGKVTSGGSTVVEHLTHHPKNTGLNPAGCLCKQRENGENSSKTKAPSRT